MVQIHKGAHNEVQNDYQNAFLFLKIGVGSVKTAQKQISLTITTETFLPKLCN